MENKITKVYRTSGVLAALSGIASGVLYQYHESVELYHTDDVSDTLGLYLLGLSLLFWAIFIGGWLFSRYTKNSS